MWWTRSDSYHMPSGNHATRYFGFSWSSASWESMFHIKHSALIKHFSTQQNNLARTLTAVPNRTTLNQCLCQKQLGESLREASGFQMEHSRARWPFQGTGVKGRVYISGRLAKKNLKQELWKWAIAGFRQIRGWKFSVKKLSKRNSWQNFHIVKHRPKSVLFTVIVSSATQKN